MDFSFMYIEEPSVIRTILEQIGTAFNGNLLLRHVERLRNRNTAWSQQQRSKKKEGQFH
ncbi:MAG: hypothetical protein IPM61_14835 [Chlorobi bacterium]|nr:hypothetical protein [Chlorobiota bacterium]